MIVDLGDHRSLQYQTLPFLEVHQNGSGLTTILSILILVFAFVCLMVAGFCIVLRPEPKLIGLLTAMYLALYGKSHILFTDDLTVRGFLKAESTAMMLAALYLYVATQILNPHMWFVIVVSIILMTIALIIKLLTLSPAKEKS